MAARVHVLNITSDYGEVRRAAEWLVALPLPEWIRSRVDALELAAAEALNNVVRHAYGEIAGRPITVRVTTGRDHVELSISDFGDAGDPATLAAELPADELPPSDEFGEHGRGLAIIRACVDALAYRRRDARNELTLTMRRASRSEPLPQAVPAASRRS